MVGLPDDDQLTPLGLCDRGGGCDGPEAIAQTMLRINEKPVREVQIRGIFQGFEVILSNRFFGDVA